MCSCVCMHVCTCTYKTCAVISILYTYFTCVHICSAHRARTHTHTLSHPSCGCRCGVPQQPFPCVPTYASSCTHTRTHAMHYRREERWQNPHSGWAAMWSVKLLLKHAMYPISISTATHCSRLARAEAAAATFSRPFSLMSTHIHTIYEGAHMP